MEKFKRQTAANGVQFGEFMHLENLKVKHGMSTRIGGVSNPPFAELNLGLRSGDEIDNVIINRQRFCEAIQVDFSRVITAQQVHGNDVAIVTAREAGRGAKNYFEALPATDALVTNEKSLPLMLFFADCVPVVIVDPVRQAIGMCHAGWKGTVAKIAQKTVGTMQTCYGTEPADCLIGIGPSIGPCCYEVDEVVITELKKGWENWQDLVKPAFPKNKWFLDLWKTNRKQLEAIGVRSENIVISGLCTSCNTHLFFSHRAEHGVTGRQAAIISL